MQCLYECLLPAEGYNILFDTHICMIKIFNYIHSQWHWPTFEGHTCPFWIFNFGCSLFKYVRYLFPNVQPDAAQQALGCDHLSVVMYLCTRLKSVLCSHLEFSFLDNNFFSFLWDISIKSYSLIYRIMMFNGSLWQWHCPTFQCHRQSA